MELYTKKWFVCVFFVSFIESSLRKLAVILKGKELSLISRNRDRTFCHFQKTMFPEIGTGHFVISKKRCFQKSGQDILSFP